MRRHYCTLFDKNYLPQALNLFQSLTLHDSDYIIYCLCMDDDCFDYISNQNKTNCIPINHKQVEDYYPELKDAQTNRSRVEYFFTCTPVVCNYVLNNYKNIDLLTYLDADLYFFSSPNPIFEELENYSIGIIRHNFSFINKRHEKHGKYNVGWISFRNDENGNACLDDWMHKCIEWCYDYLESDRFADQKYLDAWHNQFDRVKDIENIGANLAPWNIGKFQIRFNGDISVSGKKLIFYHFAGLKQTNANYYITSISRYFSFLNKTILNKIYQPYLKGLYKHRKELSYNSYKINRIQFRNINFHTRLVRLSVRFREIIFRDRIYVDSIEGYF